MSPRHGGEGGGQKFIGVDASVLGLSTTKKAPTLNPKTSIVEPEPFPKTLNPRP